MKLYVFNENSYFVSRNVASYLGLFMMSMFLGPSKMRMLLFRRNSICMTTYNYLDPTYLRERSIYVYFFYSKVILKVNLNMPKRSVDDIINDSLPVL